MKKEESRYRNIEMMETSLHLLLKMQERIFKIFQKSIVFDKEDSLKKFKRVMEDQS